MRTSEVDISLYSFDEFISFLFARNVPDAKPKVSEADHWYWHTDITFIPERVCKYYTQLFENPEFLVERFSKAQLEEGFWATQVPMDCSVYRVLNDTDLPFAVRAESVASMFQLFKQLFAFEALGTSVQMWWDSLCYDWHCGNRNRERGGEDLQLQDVFFETLSKILFLDSDTCQAAALHGLGHLHHPGTSDLIERYLQERPTLTEERKAYALAAAQFKVM